MIDFSALAFSLFLLGFFLVLLQIVIVMERVVYRLFPIESRAVSAVVAVTWAVVTFHLVMELVFYD